MLDRLAFPNVRNVLFRIFGVAPTQTLERLDQRIVELERGIVAWSEKFEKTPRLKRVLLADTEALSYDSLRRVLPEIYELSMVRDWDQLFREIRSSEVPLVVIDLALLGQEGVHNIRKLKEERPQVRVIALASYLSEAFAQAMPEGLELSGILQKPLDENFLIENLSKYLQ
jgi:DNA-binding NtrC family response regulator